MTYYFVLYLTHLMMLAIVVVASHTAVRGTSDLQRDDSYRMAQLALRYTFGNCSVLTLLSTLPAITQYQ